MAVARRVSDRLAERVRQDFVGRQGELAMLLAILKADGTPVTHLYGIGGIGKTSLLEAFALRAREHGTAVVQLDCRAIEPTERGFLHALGAAIGNDSSSVEEATERLEAIGDRVVLIIDHYEVFRLLDTWLRQVFVPALSEDTRVILSGREAPVTNWATTPGWQGLFHPVPLGPLDDIAVAEFLRHANIGAAAARRISDFARGHPLALTLAVTAAAERPDLDLRETAIGRVVEELAQLYRTDIRDPLTRRALDAAVVVRRTTVSLLRAMLPDAAPQDAYERLRTLPFATSSSDGLIIHDTVQETIAAALRASDPDTCRTYRRAAWAQLRSESRTAGQAEHWRYTADLLYMVEIPVVRDAFFPSDPHLLAMEPALPDDAPAIAAITIRHEGVQAARLLLDWWDTLPDAFSVARERSGEIAGYYAMFDPREIAGARLAADPLTRAWVEHLGREPLAPDQRVLFCRRWLSRDTGELPSPAQGACWLDIKRSYMVLRPHLRRIYVPVCDLSLYGPTLRQLQFRILPDAAVTLDGTTYQTAMLDLGPGSVDGWLGRLVAASLGLHEEQLLDVEARELVLDGRRVSLTRMEFAALNYLQQRPGKAVSRAALLADVWGDSYAGTSNVVDAVVRSLRKKLGEHASSLETVTGVGYRFRAR